MKVKNSLRKGGLEKTKNSQMNEKTKLFRYWFMLRLFSHARCLTHKPAGARYSKHRFKRQKLQEQKPAMGNWKKTLKIAKKGGTLTRGKNKNILGN